LEITTFAGLDRRYHGEREMGSEVSCKVSSEPILFFIHMTAPFTIHDEIARLQTEIDEAKKRLEFEHAFKLIAKLEALQEQDDGN
jgi:hypothetical protein